MKTHQLLCLVTVAILSGCSSSATKPSSTTIDPQIAVLQKQVEDLQTKVNATTIPTTTTTEAPKPAIVITNSGSYSIGKRYRSGGREERGCRDYVEYSDGTVDITREYWITEDAYQANDGC